MGSLGLPTPSPAPNKGTFPSTFGNMLALGGSFVGGGSIVIAAIELVRTEPDKAFKLLQNWGPWFILALFVAWVVYALASRALDLAGTVGGRIADAMESQAVSIRQLADKDDRQAQEMQVLTSLTAQRSEKTYSMMQSYHEDNQEILKLQQETLARIERKVDETIAAEKSTT